jgi:hypothetical protein
VADRLRPIEQRLAALESSRTATGANSTPILRFDAFSRETTRSREADTTANNPRSQAEPTPEAGTDWRAVKKFYKQTRSPKQTAARFDLSINTVKARVRREGW